MTSTIKSTANFDLQVGENGLLELLTGTPAVAQSTVSAMSTRQGECIYDTEQGVPFDATVFNRLRTALFVAAGRRVIAAVPGVEGINSLRVAQVGDVLEYTADIQPEGAEVPVTITFEGL